jgi:glycosyltransferase involved in cell wall biosynthesis/SAM-dependent methyltransferase
MKRILNVIHYPVFGGPHNQALRIAGPLAARGFETLVAIPDEPGNAASRLRGQGVDVRLVPMHRLRATRDVRAHIGLVASLPADVGRLRKLIRAEGVDVVQVCGLVNPHGAIAARLEHVPVVWQLLDTRAPRAIAIAAMAWVEALADVVMSTGLAVAKAHPGYPAIAERVIPYFPPVELHQFAPRPDLRSDVRAAWGVPLSPPVVGSVANINPQKGIVELVRSFAQARASHEDARLVLVGAEYESHADYSRAVRAQMAADGLVEGKDVLFLGEREDVERQLAGMDVVALAAGPRSEGITTAILEAMAAGLPVVVTDVGALREAVDDGRNGFLVPPDNPDAFVSALATLVGDPALRAQMGEEARRVAEVRFGVDSCVDAHVHAYAQALARHGRAAESTWEVGTGWAEPTNPGRVIEGIPVFVDDLGVTSHDEVDHHGHDQKDAQARHFDRLVGEGFEISRPHGAPRLYRFLLAEKFRRAVGPIEPHLLGASALSVCGGSGMDAEFLARAGAVVTSTDLSLGAALRARARSERYGLGVRSVVADVEHLPFADKSIDLVAVHDGLHHLQDPFVGLAEMARVARRWVVISEPARASITRLAIRLGLAVEMEEAGNRVARMDPSEIRDFLKARGYVVLRAERYAMFYPHHPGAVFRLLSRPLVFPVVRLGWRVANALLGRWGNKMVVVAERAQSSGTVQAPSTPSPIRSTT